MTSQRVRIPCPQCGRSLRIRVENLGRRGICKHCGNKFRAGADEAEFSPQQVMAQPGANVKPRRSSKLALRMGVLESELRAVLSHLADQSAQHASVLHELDATRRRLAEVQSVRAGQIDHEHDHDHEPRANSPDGKTRDEASGAAPRPASADGEAELRSLRDRARVASRLEEELSAERARTELLRAQILEIESRGGVLAFREPDRPQAEAEAEAEVEVEPEADSDALGVPAAGREGDGEGTPGAGRIEAERAALAREVDQLRCRLGDVEPALEEALARLDHDRAAWETERRELEARWEERHQDAVDEAEARVLTELRDAEQSGAVGDADADGDGDGDGRRLTAECEALKRVVRRLRKRLVDRDQARAELAEALAQERERWGAERRDWQAHAHAELEHRLGEQQAAIDQQRQALQGELEAARSQLAERERQLQAVARERDALATRLELGEALNDNDVRQAETLRAELESLRSIHLRAEQEHAQTLETLRGEHEAEHRQWTECAERLLREIEDARAELKGQAEAAAHQRDELAARLEQAEAQNDLGGREVERLRAELQSLQTDRQRAEQEHAQTLETLHAEHDRQRDQALANLRAQLEREHRGWMERSKQEHAQALDTLRTELEQERHRLAGRAELDHGHALTTLRAELERRHKAAIAALHAEFEDERRRRAERSDQDRTQALESLRAELAQKHAQEIAALRGEIEQEHAQALESLRNEFEYQQQRESVSAEQDQARALAALRAEHEDELRRWAEQVERLEQDLVAARAELTQQAEAVARQQEELDELAAGLERTEEPHEHDSSEVETLRAELEALRQEHQRAEQERAQALETLRAELDQERERAQVLDAMRAEFEDERRQWTERAEQLQAALNDAERDRNKALQEIERLADRPAEPGLQDAPPPPPPQVDSEGYKQTIQRLAAVLAELSNKQILTNQRKAELISQVMSLRNTLARMTTAARGELVVRPRPRSESFADVEEYRADLARWLTEAQQRRQLAGTQIKQLESELDSGRRELDLINRDLALGSWDPDDVDEEYAEIAYPFEAEGGVGSRQ
jgi:hypothetical protein